MRNQSETGARYGSWKESCQVAGELLEVPSLVCVRDVRNCGCRALNRWPRTINAARSPRRPWSDVLVCIRMASLRRGNDLYRASCPLAFALAASSSSSPSPLFLLLWDMMDDDGFLLVLSSGAMKKVFKKKCYRSVSRHRRRLLLRTSSDNQ